MRNLNREDITKLKERMDEALRTITLLPMREYEAETMLAVGTVGLDMNSFISEIFMKQQEYRDAPKYIADGRKTDVEESMGNYGKLWKKILGRVERWEINLNADIQKDTEARRAVLHFAEVYREAVSLLLQTVTLPDEPEAMEECVKQYMEGIILLCNVTRAYCRLHVGDSGYLS